MHICTQESLENYCPICPIRPQNQVGKCCTKTINLLTWLSANADVQGVWGMLNGCKLLTYMYYSCHHRNKKTAENLQISEKVSIFAHERKTIPPAEMKE